jgi:hypothetical protein
MRSLYFFRIVERLLAQHFSLSDLTRLSSIRLQQMSKTLLFVKGDASECLS